MESKIISLNVAHPEPMEWDGKSVLSSMHKKSLEGPLTVSMTNILGDSFQGKHIHGTPDSVIYAFGIPSALEYVKRLGRETYTPGALGENITLDSFDEKNVLVGDVFSFGEVLAQCTFPRMPCAKVNIRMQHSEGQTQMLESGRSGAYFRILKPGLIHPTDVMKLVSKNQTPSISIYEVYAIYRKSMTLEHVERLLQIEALPQFVLTWLKSRYMEITQKS